MAEASGESERTLKGKRKEIAGGIGPYELKINLAALRRSASDDTILEIVGTASQVALYSFNGKSWACAVLNWCCVLSKRPTRKEPSLFTEDLVVLHMGSSL
jgi:hypothetical protein